MKIKPNFAQIAKLHNLDYRTIKRRYEEIILPESLPKLPKPKTIISDFEDIINDKLNVIGVSISSIFRYIKANCGLHRQLDYSAELHSLR